MNCPVCQSQKSKFLFKKNKGKFFECLDCGLRFIQPIPKESEIKKYYQSEYWQRQSYRGENALGYLSYLAEKESFIDYFQKVLRQLKKLFPKLSGQVLDVGCSFGLFLKVAQEANWQIYGLDFSAAPVKQAQKDLGVKTIYQKSVEEAKFKANFFDLVTVFQTIEHVAQPEKFLKEAKRILKPGGLILVTTPNAASRQAKLMRNSWFSYRHPDHLYFFDFKNLSLLLKKSGFVKIRRLADPARLYPLKYLLEIFKFYRQSKFLVGLAELVKKIIGPLGEIKIPISLASLAVMAEKR